MLLFEPPNLIKIFYFYIEIYIYVTKLSKINKVLVCEPGKPVFLKVIKNENHLVVEKLFFYFFLKES